MFPLSLSPTALRLQPYPSVLYEYWGILTQVHISVHQAFFPPESSLLDKAQSKGRVQEQSLPNLDHTMAPGSIFGALSLFIHPKDGPLVLVIWFS